MRADDLPTPAAPPAAARAGAASPAAVPAAALLGAVLGAAVVAALALLAAPGASANAITSAGPLTSIAVPETGLPLSCAVDYSGYGYQFFGQQACGTYLLAGGVKYAPGSVPAGAGACTPNPCVQWAIASFTGPTGTGTAADPFRLTHTAAAGSVAVLQEDAYVTGNQFYTTNVTLTNGGASPVSGILWRAGDCYMQVGSLPDNSYGWVDPGHPGAIACSQFTNPAASGGRIIEWIPHGAGSTYHEDFYGSVWNLIGANTAFANACAQCTNYIDSGAGVSWAWTLAPGQSRTFSHDTVFGLFSGPPPPPPPPPTPPVAFFEVDASRRTCQDSRVFFTDLSHAGALPPSGAPIVSWSWDFGDGMGSDQRFPQHTYAFARLPPDSGYTAVLTVTDANGLSATTTQQVHSVGDPDCCPELGPLRSYTIKEGDVVIFQAGVSDFEGDATALEMAGMPAAALLVGTQFYWATSHGDAGTYNGTLTLRDATGESPECSDAQAFTITVLPRPEPAPEEDADMDGIADSSDDCPAVADWRQSDRDGDGRGDACDDTPCGDGAFAAADPADGRPACPDGAPGLAPPRPRPFSDRDQDGIADAADNCADMANHSQDDLDADGVGDACDIDLDGDGVRNDVDACPRTYDPAQGAACVAADPVAAGGSAGGAARFGSASAHAPGGVADGPAVAAAAVAAACVAAGAVLFVRSRWRR